MKSKLILLFLISFIAPSCNNTYSSVQKTSSNQTKRKHLPEIIYSIDKANNGNYESIEIDEENRPEPIQGKNKWIRDFYGSIKYPAIARENGIGGVVILDIEVDQKGKVTVVDIKQSVSVECDNEARRAYIFSTQGGYIPLLIDNLPTKFRMELPVGFWIE